MGSINAPRSRDLEIASHTSTFDSEYKQAERTGMTDAAHWDIEADLQFLNAHDEQLHQGLIWACDILEDDNDVEDACSAILSTAGDDNDLSSGASTATEPDEVPETPRPKRKARSTFELRQKEELKRLRGGTLTCRGVVLEMYGPQRTHRQSQIAQGERIAAGSGRRASHVHRANAKSVLQETSLRGQCALLYIACLMLRMQNHPDVHSEEWKAYKLQESLRAAAIHAMADRQYNRMNHAFLRADVLKQDDDFFRARLLPQSNGSTVYELIVEELDPCTVYTRIIAECEGNVEWQSNLIRKYYPRADSSVFVGRTVLEDAVNPPKATDMVEDKWIWIQVVPVDKSHARITTLVQIDFGFFSPATDDGNANELADFMKGLAISESSPHAVDFPACQHS
ncbi:hypothetical protein AC1031_002195 [Aphanomyces cochlioides]|nr:hypothetical protein AC1031_002195 [Aphanomyces cochlioides]